MFKRKRKFKRIDKNNLLRKVFVSGLCLTLFILNFYTLTKIDRLEKEIAKNKNNCRIVEDQFYELKSNL